MSDNTLCYGNEPGAIRLWWYCARDASGRRPLVLLYPTRSTLGECLVASHMPDRGDFDFIFPQNQATALTGGGDGTDQADDDG